MTDEIIPEIMLVLCQIGKMYGILEVQQVFSSQYALHHPAIHESFLRIGWKINSPAILLAD